MTNLSPRPIAAAGLVVGLLLALWPAAARADHLASRLVDGVAPHEVATTFAAPVDHTASPSSPDSPQARQDAVGLTPSSSLLPLILVVPPGTTPDATTASTDPTTTPTTTTTPPSSPPSNPPPSQPPGGTNNPPPNNPPPNSPPPNNPPPVTSAANPEPASLVLGSMGMGIAGLVGWVRRRKEGKLGKKG